MADRNISQVLVEVEVKPPQIIQVSQVLIEIEWGEYIPPVDTTKKGIKNINTILHCKKYK
jgi:hypothetical protein